MANIAIYKFNSGTDTLPTFNSGYTYDYTDVDNGDGTITRTITSDTLPSSISFSSKSGLVSLSYLDTSNVTTMGSMFYNCSNLTSIDVSSFNTSKVTTMNYMFNGCNKLTTLDLSSFNTSNVTYMNNMFYNCKNLTTINLSNFNTSKVTNMSDMFNGCNKLTTLDISNFNTSKVTNIDSMFTGCSSLTSVNMNNSDISSINKIITNLPTRTAYSPGTMNIGSLSGSTKLRVGNGWAIKSNNQLSKEIFKFTSNANNSGCGFNSDLVYSVNDVINNDNTITRTITSDSSPTNISFNTNSSITSLVINSVDCSSSTTMYNMFNGCKNLTSLEGLSNFDTSKVINMSQMFYSCSKLTSLDLSNFNTSKVTDMSSIFSGCSKLTTLDLSSFDISNGASTTNMFSSCTNLVSVNMDNSNVDSINKVIAQLPTRTSDSYGTMIVSKTILNSVDTTSANSKYWNVIKTLEYSFTLDTLKYLLTKLKEKFALKSEGDLKVDKVDGKDLVTNDYTDNYVQINQNALNNISISSKTDTEIKLAFESNNGNNIITIPYDKYKKSVLFVDCEENFDCYEGSEYPINYRYVSAIKEGVHKLTVEILRNNEVIKNETNITDNYLYTPNLSDTEIRMYAIDPEGTKTGITYLKPNVKP